MSRRLTRDHNRDQIDPGLKRMVVASAVAHFVFLGAVIYKIEPAPKPTVPQAVTVDLVSAEGLGLEAIRAAPKRPKAKPAARKVALPKPKAKPKAKPKPKPKAVVKSKPEPEKKPEPEPVKEEPSAPAEPEKAAEAEPAKEEAYKVPDATREIIEEWRRRDAVSEIEERLAAKEGRAGREPGGVVAGPGGAAEGAGGEIDPRLAAYYRDLRDAIKAHWIVPEFLHDAASKHPEIYIRFDTEGKVRSLEVRVSSGNSAYDETALRAIEKAAPLPMPPEEFREEIFKGGVGVTFEPEDEA